MTGIWNKAGQRWLVPEVVQTSAMDCGPASLKSLLSGFSISASYDRLREACQTDVDGTSIDVLEDLGNQLGLDVSQVVVPVDHVFLEAADILPALAVVRLPNGNTHFVVLWRTHGSFVQVMDPASGRTFRTTEKTRTELYLHEAAVPADAFREWARSAPFLRPLEKRILALTGRRTAKALIEAALAEEGDRIAFLDASVRMTSTLVRARAIQPGKEAARFLDNLISRAASEPDPFRIVPRNHWYATRSPDSDETVLRGAVMLRARAAAKSVVEEREEADVPGVAAPAPPISRVLEAPGERPLKTAFASLRARWLFAASVVLPALVLASMAVVLEGAVFRTLFEVVTELQTSAQQIGIIVALSLFAAAVGLVEWPAASGLARLGRELENRFRIALLMKIPELDDRYFSSRPVSDMAERSHIVHRLRELPAIAGMFLRSTFELGFTVLAIIWLDPGLIFPALLLASFAVLAPIICTPLLSGLDLRARTHQGSLMRFYLDVLLGLVPARTHGAQRAITVEHDSMREQWARAAHDLVGRGSAVELVQGAIALGFSVWILGDHVGRLGVTSTLLLTTYWTLNLPVLGEQIAAALRQYPGQRNILLRLLEPLAAVSREDTSRPSCIARSGRGVTIQFEHVAVHAAGHPILADVTAKIEQGTHVAIVGTSGAGKSTLLSLLLGWHRPSAGTITVDGQLLDGNKVEQIRSSCAWLDPAVHLWNRSVLENIRFGHEDDDTHAIGKVLDDAELRGVVEKLEKGFETKLGEGGKLVSGGEGQRVRLARTFFRARAPLVLFDEPFRGLDRTTRKRLLDRARSIWRHATFLCVTHDIEETAHFDRVWVIENGRIVENDTPDALARMPDSKYRQMLEADRSSRVALWKGWRQIEIREGALIEPRVVREKTARSTVDGPSATKIEVPR